MPAASLSPEPVSRALRPPPPAGLRWLVLVLVSLALFGNYYAYDAIGPLADNLQRLLGYTDTQLGMLNAIYSLPNVAMVLVGGVVVDRLGARRAVVIFTAICLVGAILTAISPAFPVMATGRLVFGLGAESMIVAITTLLGQWFAGRELGFAFGINISIARMGSYSADMSTTWAKPLYDSGWQAPLWLAASMVAMALVAALTYHSVERTAARRYELAALPPTGRIVWRDLLRFDRSYWYVAGICVAFYSVIFPFRSTFAIKYFQHAHELSLQEAGSINGVVYLAAIVATPLFGLLVDRVGGRALALIVGSALLVAVFPLLAWSDASLWIPTILIGISFSLVPAVLWPAIAYLSPAARLGTAFGLMTLLENVGMMLANLGAGWLNDANGAGAANPAGYTPMLLMFGLLALAGVVFAVLLRQRELGPAGHGLEGLRPAPKAAPPAIA